MSRENSSDNVPPMVPTAGALGEIARLELPAAGSSPSRARKFVMGLLSDWDLPGCEDAVTLLVSELVTNALLHARTEMVVVLARADGCVRLEVSDRSIQSPVIRRYSLHAGTGRGLQLVGSVARSWGVRLENGGKTVWAEIAAAAEFDEAVVPFDIDSVDAL